MLKKILALAFALVMCLATVTVASAPPLATVVYVDPPVNTGNPCQSFDINITVTDVVDLYSWAIKVGFDGNVLTVTSVTEGPLLKSVNPTFFIKKIYTHYADVACVTLGAIPGVSGSGTLMTITFHVKEVGDSSLDIYDDQLLDSTLTLIDHTTEDGYFYSLAEADLVKKKAWPEHRHFDVSKDEDAYQNLTGKVKNLGPIDLKVYVEFDLVRDDGYIAVVQTSVVVVSAGTEVDLVAMFGPLMGLDLGKYAVVATCWYSYTGTYWTQGDHRKAFSFTLVP